jgi:hypothetical protein
MIAFAYRQDALLRRGGRSYVPVNDEQVLQLRRWAERLAADERADVRAAAKAIVLLTDEVKALRGRQPEESEAIEADAETTTIAPTRDDGSADEFGSVLRGRLRSFARARHSKHEPERHSEESTQGDGRG